MTTLTKTTCIDMTHAGIIILLCCQRQAQIFVKENVNSKTLLNNFGAEYSYLISDRPLLPANTFMHVNDCHCSSTWIDHCLSSASFHQAIQSMTVLQDIIMSDHGPFAFDISCADLPTIEIKTYLKLSNNVMWRQVTSDQKCAYSLMCKKLFSEIN